ncbi:MULTISPECIES: hypothetical protein [unclassified Streptomyces]|uniref:hypothetical protein n=1 Tax=unclassified Streptomyces TaxID=2593676 RepID=UPI0037A987C8
MNRLARTLLPITMGAALMVPLAHSATAVETGAPGVSPTAAGKKVAGDVHATVSRDSVIQRAKTWLTANNGSQVPYSQTATFGGYRADCSGYVSMALQYGKPGANTVMLASSDFTTPINIAQLTKGDLIIDAAGSSTTRHVVIFEKWTSSAHTSYKAYEQRGGHGTDYRTLSYGIGADEYDAYRPKKY